MTTAGQLLLGTDGKPITVGRADGCPSRRTALCAGHEGGRRRSPSCPSPTPSSRATTLFTGTPGAKPAETTVEQGYLEGSGVEPARAMVDMIVSLRAYEASQRVLHAIDDTLGKGIRRRRRR